MKPRVAVVGSTNWDMSITVPHLPAPKETVHGGSCQFSLGGKGANQAIAAARAGAEVFFVSCVGDDSVAREVLQAFETDNISPTGILVAEATETGKAMIFVDRHGENFIGVADGANAKLLPEQLTAFEAKIADADILLLQLEIPLNTVTTAAAIAQKHNTQVILNPAPARAIDNALLNASSILTPNQVEMEKIAGIPIQNKSDLQKATHALLDKGLDTILVTLGSEGVYIATAERATQLPAYKVKAVDTTAAGDVFNGTLAVALASGQGILDAAEFASAASALSVTVPGAMPSIPYRDHIDQFAAQHTLDK